MKQKTMKHIYILISIVLCVFFGHLLSSCSSSDSTSLDFLDEEVTALNSQNLIGAWTLNTHYTGKVFLQFEVDGTLRIYFNYEGEHLETVSWKLVGDKIVTSGSSLFLNWSLGMQPYYWEEGSVSGLKISDFNYNSFKLSPKDNQVKEDEPILVASRLMDEAGEPIIHYSLFQREVEVDPRYSESITQENSQNSDYETEVNSDNSSNYPSVESRTESNNSLTKVWICEDCSKILTGENQPYDNSHCPEYRWKDYPNKKDNNHNYSSLSYIGTQTYNCRRCGVVTNLKDKPQYSRTCAMYGNSWEHQWQRQ